MQPNGPKSPYITITPLFLGDLMDANFAKEFPPLWLILTSVDEFKFVQIFGIRFGDTLFTIVSRLEMKSPKMEEAITAYCCVSPRC